MSDPTPMSDPKPVSDPKPASEPKSTPIARLAMETWRTRPSQPHAHDVQAYAATETMRVKDDKDATHDLVEGEYLVVRENGSVKVVPNNAFLATYVRIAP